MMRLAAALFLSFWALSSLAKDVQWNVSPDSKVVVRIGYTFGTHDLKSNTFAGSLSQGGALESVAGDISLPIASLKESNKTLECHLRESLGLDYEKSGFPEKHVCDDKDELPAEGGDSVVFPDIKLTIKSLKAAEKSKFGEARFQVEGDWTVHGVTKPANDFLVIVKEDAKTVSV
ncbi:MAG: hypothetical protein ABL958_18455, partial [Bdellovibrionia bacterium]